MLFFFIAVTASVQSQATVDITRVEVQWPMVDLYFNVTCDGDPAYDISTGDVALTEDRKDVSSFSLSCEDPSPRCAVSAVLVLDASASLAGSGNMLIKSSAQAFIDAMDGDLDEAAVLFFDQEITIAEPMVPTRERLHDAVDGLPASGTAAILDAAYAGILELVDNGVNQCRAVILMTDGNDDGSQRTAGEVVSLANRNNIALYTVGIGVTVQDTELKVLARETGGRYYHLPDRAAMFGMYRRIGTLQQMEGECHLRYRSICPDGSMRYVELQLPQFCKGNASDTISFQAPLDSSQFYILSMDLNHEHVRSGDSVAVWMTLSYPMAYFHMPRFSTKLLFDTQYLEFLGVEKGPVFGEVPLLVENIPGGIRMETLDTMQATGGLMCLLHFRASEVQSVQVCDITAEDAVLAGGCRIPKIDQGGVTIFPETTEPVLRIEPFESTVHVVERDGTFYPKPVALFWTIRNIGSVETDSVFATIAFPPGLSLSYRDEPDSYTKFVSPSMTPFGGRIMTWWPDYPIRRTEQRYTVTLTAYSGNADSTTSSVEIIVPPGIPPPFSFSLAADGALDLCEGDTVTLDAGGGFTSWRWNTGDSLRHLTVGESGSYFCVVTDSSGETGHSDTLTVNVHPSPEPVITPQGTIPLCSNESIALLASDGYVRYAWNTGDSTQRIDVGQAGAYRVRVLDTLGCEGESEILEVTVIPAPAAPLISRDGDELQSTPAHAYQWQLSGQDIPGATERILALPSPGTYRVRVFAENGCSEYSDPFDVTVLDAASVSSATGYTLSAWPAPVRDQLHVNATGPPGETVRVLLSDVLGRTVLLHEGRLPAGSMQFTYPMDGYHSGPLLLLMFSGDGFVVRKLMKE
ncbi:MAG: VWA domain-containing protein [Bacteroidetes bacterium]|nr:VWA domain-containing protein [Bacteroidota bacterium]